MLWDFRTDKAQRFFNSWNTGIKIACNCPKSTKTYLAHQVLSCGSTSAETEIMARYCKFFRGLRASLSREVQCLANLLARDVRSCIGSNLWLVAEISGKDPWMDGPDGLRLALQEAETVTVPDRGKWRVG